MSLPKTPIPELIDDLRELARASFVSTFPNIEEGDTIESEAAEVLEQVEALLIDVVADNGPFADRARSILNR